MSFRAAFFPPVSDANPYWTILASSLGAFGCDVTSVPFGRRSLWQNRRTIQILHFHFVQQFYAYEGTQARLRWVLRFASNLVLARLLGYRTVFTLHNATPTYPLQPKWVDYLGHWAAVNLTNSVIVHCDAARRLVARRFGRRRRVYTVPHPHYMDCYPNATTQSSARAALGIAPDRLVFAFIGGIRPNKGVEKLIAAFKQLQGDDLSLMIAGKAWPPDEYIQGLESTARQDSRIVFHKRFIPEDELQTYFNAADVIVLPFERILTSGSAFLAMGFARPVIAPSMGCLPELVTEDAGMLYDPASRSGLLEVLARCRDKRRELGTMGAKAQAKVAEFSGQSMAEKTLRAYEAKG